MKTNCYDCKFRHEIVGDAHSECRHPSITEADRIIAPFALMAGITPPIMKRINVSGNATGVRKGWFMWPLHFDPIWLETCDGFERR